MDSRVSLNSTQGDSRPSSDQDNIAMIQVSESNQEEFSSDTKSSASASVVSWISWFCSLPGHEYFIEIPEAWIEDDFNLTGLASVVPLYPQALDMILDLEEEEDPNEQESDDDMGNESDTKQNTKEYVTILLRENVETTFLYLLKDFLMDLKPMEIEKYAQLLYTLLHARFILTKAGLHVYKERFEEFEFGTCPRSGCGGCPVIPCGLSDSPNNSSFKLYCPRCMDIYQPKQSKFASVDGCSFGTSFHSLLFLTYPELCPDLQSENNVDDADGLYKYSVYTPKIFGFKVSKLAVNAPKMDWLRRRKDDGLTPTLN